MRPSARSLSATMARGVGEPGRVPLVWSLFSVMMFSCGISPLFSRSANSRRNSSARIWSGMAVVLLG